MDMIDRSLSPDDAIVWRRFLERVRHPFKQFEYQVRLGSTCDCEGSIGSKAELEWERLTQKRCDVVGYADGFIACIEVKPRMAMSAMGQALTYAWLFEEEKRPTLPVEAWVVAGELDAVLAPVYSEFDVVFVVP
jgi:hypothetical protein